MQVWLVDTFAEDHFKGNPAGVVRLDDKFLPTDQMQAIACRLTLPTTAFVVPRDTCNFHIRWFTPEKELNICGHATIATASYLYHSDPQCQLHELCFHTTGGRLYAQRRNQYISLKLPRMEVTTCDPPPGLEESLGVPVHHCARASDDILVEFDSAQTVAAIEPNFHELRKIACRGHIITAVSDEDGVDFVSRTFFPAMGVNEDQVCVSAHCKLGPYWSNKLHQNSFAALQLSPRGGRLILDVTDDAVFVAGTALVRQPICVSP